MSLDLSAIESVAVSVITDVAKALSSDSPTSTLSSATSQATSQDGIQSLVSVADSLIDSVYPSATLTNLGALTWPSTVVIGSSTYIIHTASPTGLSTSATPTANSAIDSSSLSSVFSISSTAGAVASSTSTPDSGNSSAGNISNQSHDPWDRRLGIILGVVLGSIALFITIFLVWFLHRRHKKTGSFLKGRASSPSDEEVLSWRNNGAAEKYDENPSMIQQPMAAHGAFASRSWTRDDDGFAYRGHELAPAELAAEHSARPSRDHDIEDRPPTPFSPAAFAAMARSPVSPISTSQHNAWPQTPNNYHDSNPFLRPSESQELEDTQVSHDVHPGYLQHQPRYQNPFSSPEDDEDETESMLEPPDIPSRSPRRRSSPQVMYPSGEELDRFRFWS